MKKKNKIKIEKREVMYAALGLGFLLIWFFYIKDEVVVKYLSNIHPFLATALYYLGFLISLLLLSSILGGKFEKYRFRIIFSVISILVAFDIFGAPYLVTRDGIIIKTVELWFIKPDAAFAALYFSLGMQRRYLWVSVYIITIFVLLFLIPIILLAPKQLKKIINDW